MAKEKKAGFANRLSGEPQVKSPTQELEVEEEVVVANNSETEPLSENPVEQVVPISAVKDLVKQMLEEERQNQIPIVAPAVEETKPQRHITAKDQNFDDIPELRNWVAKDRTYVLVGREAPLSQEIRSRHKPGSSLQYLNRETNEQFSLFYSDTQISFFKEKHTGDSLVTKIFVKDGNLQTRADQVKLQKFLAIHPDNVANGGGLFEEFNPSKEAEKEIENEDLLFDAQKLARELKFTQQDAVARLMCPDYKDTWEPAELKRALFNVVKKEPERFIKLANDRTLEVKGIAKTAVSQGLLIYRNRKFFNESEEFLCELMAKDQDEWTVIANYLSSAQGNSLYEYLKHKIS